MVTTLAELKDAGLKEFKNQKHYRNGDPTFLPIHLTGGIGDVLMALDAIDYLAERYSLVVYTHHIEAFKYFNKITPAFKILPELTWNLEFNTIAKFHFRQGFHGFANDEHNQLFLQQQTVFDKDPELETLIKTHFSRFYLISHYAKRNDLDRRQMPMHCLGIDDRLKFTSSLDYKEKIITIHDGFDIHNRSIVTGRATKTWSWDHWRKLVNLIHYDYPAHKIIQLGASPTARAIDGVDECLIDQTTIEEAFNIIKKSSLHIDGDSGLVHAAARLGASVISMWGPTPDKFYGYDHHRVLRSDICEGSCYGIKSNWNDRCPIGHATPVCMDAITPERVMKEVHSVLG